MKKKSENNVKIYAFTIVELLGIIIILGIIALIAFPLVNYAIKNSKEEALKRTIETIEKAAHNYSVENDIGFSEQQKVLEIEKLKEAGFLPKEIIDPITEKEIEGCVLYRWVEEIKQHKFIYKNPCEVEKPNITITYDKTKLTNGWLKENILVNLNGDGDSIKYCISEEECVPEIIENTPTYAKGIEKEGINYICAIAVKGEIESEKKCEVLKLDKTAPTISGIDDKKLNINDEIDLKENVTYNDTLSGIDGELLIEPSTIDTSSVGTKKVKYSIKDKAGNIREVVRNIVVDAEAPTITYSLVNESSINSNGWAKNNFYVKATITDNSGTGIKSAKSCVSNSSSECVPSANITENTKDFLIQVEGNNRACVEVVDNNNKTTKLCSDTYKLDKTKPTAGTATFTGTLGTNGWYKSNVTVKVINGSDSLSGHHSTTSNVNTVTETKGQTIIIKTIDKAGNEQTRNYSVKVDTTAPTIPTITGGRSSYGSNQTISVSKASTDSISGFSYYEYYIKSGSAAPSISTNGTRITGSSKTFNTAYNGEYIFFRAVDNAGNKSGWSNGQRLYIQTTKTVTLSCISSYYNSVCNGSCTATQYISDLGAVVSVNVTSGGYANYSVSGNTLYVNFSGNGQCYGYNTCGGGCSSYYCPNGGQVNGNMCVPPTYIPNYCINPTHFPCSVSISGGGYSYTMNTTYSNVTCRCDINGNPYRDGPADSNCAPGYYKQFVNGWGCQGYCNGYTYIGPTTAGGTANCIWSGNYPATCSSYNPTYPCYLTSHTATVTYNVR